MMNWLMTMSEAVEAVAEQAASEAAGASAFVNLPLISKGLLTTGLGLLGVFLVLGLLLVTIKGMQRIKTKDEEN